MEVSGCEFEAALRACCSEAICHSDDVHTVHDFYDDDMALCTYIRFV